MKERRKVGRKSRKDGGEESGGRTNNMVCTAFETSFFGGIFRKSPVSKLMLCSRMQCGVVGCTQLGNSNELMNLKNDRHSIKNSKNVL